MLLAHCPNCEYLYKCKTVGMGGGVGILTLSGNRETCPRCGGWAHPLDGVYSTLNDTLRIIEAPQLTMDMYQRFGAVVAAKQAGSISDEEFEKKAAEIAPEFGKAAKLLLSRKVHVVVLGILLTMISQCSTNLNVTLDINKAIEQFNGVPSIERSVTERTDHPLEDGVGQKEAKDTEPSQDSPDIQPAHKAGAKPSLPAHLRRLRNSTRLF